MSDKRVAVVTGASSGIGAAIVARLAAGGYRVYGASRSTPADAGGVEHITLDVCDDESVRAGVAGILDATGRIDVLVNNAGYLCAGAVEEISLADAKAQFETNYFGVARMTVAVLPAMREAGRGHIITVSSLAGLVPLPFWGHYNASKFAVEGLMETLRHEVRPFGILVAMVEPASIKTPFYARPQAPGLDAYAQARGNAFAALAGFESKAPGPDLVARKVVALADDAHPPLRNKITGQARQLTLLRRMLPAGAFESGVRRAFKLTAGSSSQPTPPTA
jgi:NAD(P)-dependent dehydrogenase (short-subunit alcohol dehydrogenase family)